MNSLFLSSLLRDALLEDIRSGDVTTQAVVSPDASAVGYIRAKAPGIVAGLEVASEVFRQLDPTLILTPRVLEGHTVDATTILLEVSGPAASIVTAERVALNFLGHLSGIATLTRQFVDRVEPYSAHIIDTRKTTPGLRYLEKYAVRMGGGRNHRFALDDGVLLKENHLRMGGGIRQCIERARSVTGHMLHIQVEVTTLEELEQALAAGADAVLLDNMALDTMEEAVRRVNRQIPIEASGGMNLERVEAVAATGVDLISVGQLTHSAPALDVSLLLEGGDL